MMRFWRKRDTCAFCRCKGHEFPPEHWIPKWLSRALIPTHARGVIHVVDGNESEELADAFELTVPHVCQRCNETWMSNIESRAKEHVLPLILGTPEPQMFTNDGLEHVAKWSYLKIISLELGRPDELRRIHTDAIYPAFKKSRKPPYPNCSLALGLREFQEGDRNPIFVWWNSQVLPMKATPPPGVDQSPVHFEGYRTTLAIGCLVIDVIGADVPTLLDVKHGAGFQVLWPLPVTGGTFVWPPAHRFTSLEPGGLRSP